MTDTDWIEAKEHCEAFRKLYCTVVRSVPRIKDIRAVDILLTRYNEGERTEELFKEMRGVE